jgi:hypothetical protein
VLRAVSHCSTLPPGKNPFAVELNNNNNNNNNKTPGPESVSELYRQSDRRLSKLVTTSADRGCGVVSVTDPYGRIFAFLDRSR